MSVPWRDACRPIIARVLTAHPEGGADLRQALRDAYPFGERRNHPYQIWRDEIARQTGRKPKLGSRVVMQREPDPRQEELF